MLNFTEYRKVPDRLSDVLPWAALVGPGIVLNKDGSFQATIRYRGPDLASSTQSELMVNTAQVNNILKRLGSSWAVFAEAIRRSSDEYPDATWPNDVAALIDAERHDSFRLNRHFSSDYFVTLTYLPQTESATKFTSLFLTTKDGDRFDYTTVLENFQSEVTRVADLLGRTFPESKLLSWMPHGIQALSAFGAWV